MGQPAARISDFHVCPMVTPGTPPIPHVGGPVLPPGTPTVLIGNLPAACVGDMCLCTGPPDAIVMGAITILIGNKPAARLGSTTTHGGSILMGFPTVLLGEGLSAIAAVVSPEVMAMIIQSPTLVANLIALTNGGWTVQAGTAGGGTFANRSSRTITIDPNDIGNPLGCTQSLAHETGHAMYTLDPEVPMDGLSREQYVEQNTARHLRDEGEATLTNAEVREEILHTSGGGSDIGIAGTHTDEYQGVYDRYRESGDRNAARDEIGGIFGHGEHPSNSTGQDYSDYYGSDYGTAYDNAHPHP